ncbi:nSTAND1 domain-containing NTPase [Micromonospora sediminicola]|uniref:nSTAND1 domain-containing NTPase n=1 Tax=Micromonospora sediminicola TaxID=946078 RepID=UPI0037B03231
MTVREARQMPIESALVRVWRGDAPVGAGFLAGPTHLLTAAHVVADALGRPSGAPSLAGEVEVDFPLLAPGRRHRAEVVAWQPVGADDSGDVAGLRLLDPPPEQARPLSFARHRALSDAQLVMVGFPPRLELGSWVYGRTGGSVATGWVEILSDDRRPSTLDRGFSGSPVWDTEVDAVVGMVVRKVTGAPPRIGYLVPTDRILPVWPELARSAESDNPYRGLRAFGEQDADLFFGRTEQARRLAEQATSVRVLCLVGPSGVGKSSLLHAGVLPRLRDRPRLGVAVLRPGDADTPLLALALALDRLTDADPSPAGRLDRATGLATALARHPVDALAAVAAAAGVERLVLVVDQFEEVFTQPPPARRALVEVLRTALRPAARVSVVLAMQDTFLGACLRDPAMAELAAGWLPATIAELTPEQLREVIEGPLARVGPIGVEPGLVDRIVEDVRDAPNPLPLVQFTLTELWQRRRAGALTHQAYDALGGVRGALADYAERVWEALDPPARAAAERLLVQLTRPLPESNLSVRRTAVLADLDDARLAVAQRLATTRLLVLRTAGTVPGVELAHESLVSRWARLRALVERHREFRIWQDLLRLRMAGTSGDGTARRWLTGADLREAGRWTATHGDQMTVAERGFVTGSRRRRRQRVVAVGVTLAVALGVVTTTWRSTAEQRAEIAAEDLAAKAAARSATDSYGARQLALRAWRTDPDLDFGLGLPDRYDGVDALVPSYEGGVGRAPEPTPSAATPEPPRGDWFGTDLSQQVSGDGRALVTLDAAGRPTLWSLTDRVRRDGALTRLSAGNVTTMQPTVSRDGNRVAFVQSVLPTLRTDAAVDAEGLPKPDPADYPTCRPTSLSQVLTCLVVYDVRQRRVHSAVVLGGLGAASRIRDLSIDPTGRTMAVLVSGAAPGETDWTRNTVVLWDVDTGAELGRSTLPWRSLIGRLWLGPGGRDALLIELPTDDSGAFGTRTVLSAVTLTGAATRRVLVDGISDVAMSADWRTVAVTVRDRGGDRARVTVLDASSRRPVTPVLTLRDEERNGSIALDATGSTLALSWQPGVFNATDTTLTHLGDTASRLTLWSLPDGVRAADSHRYADGWRAAVPLGRAADGAFALIHTTTVGVVLPAAGKPPPLRRLGERSRARLTDSAADVMPRLCALLADPNTDDAVRPLVPRDAYQEDLCPS